MFPNSYLDHLINPSFWSRSSCGVERLVKHVEFIEKHSKIVLENTPHELNVPYGTESREILNIIGTDLPEGSPIFIHVHGGYWQEQLVRSDNGIFIAKNLYSNGIKSIFVGYELCPKVTLEKLGLNIEIALKKCLEYAKKHGTSGIYLAGHSAGAQIISMLFKSFIPSLSKEDQSLFKAAFLITGVYDVTAVLHTNLNDLLHLDQQTAVNASPLYQDLRNTNCHMVVVTAKFDTPRLILQGEDMYKYLKGKGFSTEYIFLDDLDHFDAIECLYNKESELTKNMIKCCTTK
ncbi:kynurenine formamidase [Diabrotica virgifera virgifera]|uniref:Kynurenine formamidase n=1 Tax=Diabrotica virgifera virgifera TaxID=50390 RepID=A0A6P7FY19_DIAVI|nr:kynurenine formamidase [Diabrotica virgifera virgifera]